MLTGPIPASRATVLHLRSELRSLVDRPAALFVPRVESQAPRIRLRVRASSGRACARGAARRHGVGVDSNRGSTSDHAGTRISVQSCAPKAIRATALLVLQVGSQALGLVRETGLTVPVARGRVRLDNAGVDARVPPHRARSRCTRTASPRRTGAREAARARGADVDPNYSSQRQPPRRPSVRPDKLDVARAERDMVVPNCE